MRRFILLLITVALSVSLGALQPENALAQSEGFFEQKAINIVTLGDSYSAGSGNYSDYLDDGCRRSDLSYSGRYVDMLRSRGERVDYLNKACHGWVSSQVSTQLDSLSFMDDNTNLIFITVGGNDLDFPSIAKKCIVNIVRDADGCYDLITLMEPRVDGVIADTRDLLAKIKLKAPNAEIVLVGYPYLIGDCNYKIPGLSTDLRTNSSYASPNDSPFLEYSLDAGRWIRDLHASFNGKQSGIAYTDSKVHHVSMLSSFDKHELKCGYDNLEYLTEPADNWWGEARILEAIHPNEMGQWTMAYTIDSDIRNFRNLAKNTVTDVALNALMYNQIVLDPFDPLGQAFYYTDTGVIKHIPDQRTFYCIKQEYFAPEFHVSLAAINSKPRGADIQCIDGGQSAEDYYFGEPIIVRDAATEQSYAYHYGEYWDITNSETFNCLGGWDNVVFYQPENLNYLPYTNEADCFLNDDAQFIVDAPNGSFIVAPGSGWSEIKSQTEFYCLKDKGIKSYLVSKDYKDSWTKYDEDLSYCPDRMTEYSGNIITDNGRSYYVHNSGAIQWIKYQGDYQCFVGLGSKVVSKVDSAYLDRYGKLILGSASCVNNDYYNENMITLNGASYYVHSNGDVQWIKWQGDYQCFKSLGSIDRGVAEEGYINSSFNRVDGYASCLNPADYNGKIVKVKEDAFRSYFVENGFLKHIPTGEDYNCLTSWGVPVLYNVEEGYLLDGKSKGLLKDGGDRTCKYTRSQLNNKLYKSPYTGAKYLIDSSGFRKLNLSGDWYCLSKRGYTTVTTALDSFYTSRMTHGKNLSCYETNTYKSKIVRNSSNGVIYYVDGNGYKRWIPDWMTYLCMQRKYSRSYINVSSTTVSRLPETTKITCFDKNVVDNTIIRMSNGTSYWIDGAGRRFWIPNSSTFNCFGGWGKVKVNNVSTTYIYKFTYYGTARCYSGKLLNGKIIRNYAGDTHVVDWRGYRHWIPNGSVFNYFGGWGRTVNGVSRTTINYIPERRWAYWGMSWWG